MISHNYFVTKYDLPLGQHLSAIIPSPTYETLSKLIYDSFHRSINEIYYMQPSILYLLTTDLSRLNVIASAAITYSIPTFISRESVKSTNICYLFNVCTSPEFRGKRIMEKLLIYMFKDLSHHQPLTILLIVDPDNSSAKKLYYRLGFRIINQLRGVIPTAKGYAELLSFKPIF